MGTLESLRDVREQEIFLGLPTGPEEVEKQRRKAKNPDSYNPEGGKKVGHIRINFDSKEITYSPQEK